jgi:lipoate---protein ligase
MLCIFSINNDVFFNLASEEYLLKNVKDEILILWRSTPSVVVGKHQNTFAEINHNYIRENNIPVARRLTGGGTVFHDEGNLNFTFIKNGEEGKLVDFKKFINPVIDFLKSLKIGAEIGSKNEILINNLKISGNAEHIYKTRVLHHGTLLFSSDLKKLGEALRVTSGRYIDKAVQSNRSQVTNISDYLIQKLSIDNFAEQLFNFLLNKNTIAIAYKFESEEIRNILKLRDEKYNTWEWIYGYSPPFYLRRKIIINEQECVFDLKIVKGRISEIDFSGYNLKDSVRKLFENMKGLQFDYAEIVNYISNSHLDESTKDKFPLVLF